MLRMCASNSHSYTHLIQALGIVREPPVWVFITSKYPGTHDIGLPIILSVVSRLDPCEGCVFTDGPSRALSSIPRALYTPMLVIGHFEMRCLSTPATRAFEMAYKVANNGRTTVTPARASL